PIERDKPFRQAGEIKLPIPKTGDAAHLKILDLPRPNGRTESFDLARPKESQAGQGRLREDEPRRRPHHLTQKTAAFPLFIGEFFGSFSIRQGDDPPYGDTYCQPAARSS